MSKIEIQFHSFNESVRQPAQVNLVRKKAWHHKTRDGCLICRSRRVKCDLGLPTCLRCVKYGSASTCRYPPKTPTWGIPTRTFEPNQEDLAVFPLGLRDFEFYHRNGAPMIAQWMCPTFWLTTLPTGSTMSFANKCALLAMSTTTQQFTSTSPDDIQQVAKRGDVYYGRACSTLTLKSTLSVEEALTTSFVLWCYDWGFGRHQQSFVHGNASVKLYQSLERDDNTSGQTELTQDSRSAMLGLVRAFFRDMHFPIENAELLRMLERRAQRKKPPLWRPLPLMNPFAELATPKRINSFFWLIVMADSKEALYTIQQALNDCEYELAQNPLPQTSDHEIFKNEIWLYHLFIRLHLCDDWKRNPKINDELMTGILDIIQVNIQLAEGEAIPSNGERKTVPVSGPGSQQIQCYFGLLGLIGHKASDPNIRFRAFNQIMHTGRSG